MASRFKFGQSKPAPGCAVGTRLFSMILLAVSFASLSGGGYSALHNREPKPLPPQTFAMEPFDDVLELQSQELSNYLNYKGSTMNPIVKVTVSCYLDTKNNHCPQAVHFQELWFRDGDPIGSKQSGQLPLPERDQVAILLKPRLQPLSQGEISACAAALARLRLALSLNRNLIALVRVPAVSMDSFVAALRKQNFIPYQEARERINVLIPITLESEMGKRVVTCFVP